MLLLGHVWGQSLGPVLWLDQPLWFLLWLQDGSVSWEQKLCLACSWLDPEGWVMPSRQWCSIRLCRRTACRAPSHRPCDTCSVSCSHDVQGERVSVMHKPRVTSHGWPERLDQRNLRRRTLSYFCALGMGFWWDLVGDKNDLWPWGWGGERNWWQVTWLVPRTQALQKPSWRSHSCSTSSEFVGKTT